MSPFEFLEVWGKAPECFMPKFGNWPQFREHQMRVSASVVEHELRSLAPVSQWQPTCWQARGDYLVRGHLCRRAPSLELGRCSYL